MNEGKIKHKKFAGILLISLLLTATILNLSPKPASATAEVHNGRKFFRIREDGEYRIKSMRPDGTDEKTIISSPTDSLSTPKFTKDGLTMFYYVRYNNNAATSDIYKADLSKTDIQVQNLTNRGDVVNDSVGINGDGTKLVFGSTRDNIYRELYTMNNDGTNIQRVTNNNFYDGNPTVIDSSNKIVFQTSEGISAANTLSMMDYDGTNRERLFTDSLFNVDVSLDYDQKYMYFASRNSDGATYDIYRANIDGTNKTRLTFDLSSASSVARLSPENNEFFYPANGVWKRYDLLTNQSETTANSDYITQPSTIHPKQKPTAKTDFENEYSVLENVGNIYDGINPGSIRILSGNAEVNNETGVISSTQRGKIIYIACSYANENLCSEFEIYNTIIDAIIEAPNTGAKKLTS